MSHVAQSCICFCLCACCSANAVNSRDGMDTETGSESVLRHRRERERERTRRRRDECECSSDSKYCNYSICDQIPPARDIYFYHKRFTFLNKSDIIMAWSYRENGKCVFPLLCRIFASLVCEKHLSFQTRVKKSSLSVYACFVNIAVFIFVFVCVHWLVLSSFIFSEESLNLSLITCYDRLKQHHL